MEAAADDVLGVGAFDAHGVDQHVVVEVEGRVERVCFSFEHAFGDFGFHLLVDHQDRDAFVVEATPACPAGHLDVLSAGQPAEVLSVELADRGEDDGACRHVESHGEGFSGEEDFEEAEGEEDFDDFFDDGEEASVVDADASLEYGEHLLDLGEFSVFGAERAHRVGVHGDDGVFLVFGGEVELQHRHRVAFHFALAEGEDDDGVELLLHDQLDDLVQVRAVRVLRALPLVFDEGLHARTHRAERFLEAVLAELALLVDDQVDAFSPGREDVVLQRHGAEVGVDHVAGLALDPADPLGEVARVGDGGREEDVADARRAEDHGLFPDDASLAVAHVVHLVEDDPGDLFGDLGAAVEHAAEDLGGHHETGRVLVLRDVAGDQADVFEDLAELSVLLVAQGLDRRGVDHALLVAESRRDGVLGDCGLACRGVRSHEDAFAVVDAVDGFLLERVQRELVLAGRRPLHALGSDPAFGPEGLVDAADLFFEDVYLELLQLVVRLDLLGFFEGVPVWLSGVYRSAALPRACARLSAQPLPGSSGWARPRPRLARPRRLRKLPRLR